MMIDKVLSALPLDETGKIIQKAIKGAQVVEISNVAEYVANLPADHLWGRDSFPNMAPPWPSVWFEWRNFFNNSYSCAGVFALFRRLDQRGGGRLAEKFDFSRIDAGARWIFRTHVFYMIPQRGGISVDSATILGVLGSEGSLLEYGEGPLGLEITFPKWLEDPTEKEFHDSGLQMVFPFFALCLVNCKNTKVVENKFPPKLVKAKRRRGKPVFTWKTLEVPGALSGEGAPRASGMKKAFHLVRGHFAHYTAERPLFGRVVGTFWKEQHTRGSVKEGIVVKDYKVKAPKAGEG